MESLACKVAFIFWKCKHNNNFKRNIHFGFMVYCYTICSSRKDDCALVLWKVDHNIHWRIITFHQCDRFVVHIPRSWIRHERVISQSNLRIRILACRDASEKKYYEMDGTMILVLVAWARVHFHRLLFKAFYVSTAGLCFDVTTSTISLTTVIDNYYYY